MSADQLIEDSAARIDAICVALAESGPAEIRAAVAAMLIGPELARMVRLGRPTSVG